MDEETFKRFTNLEMRQKRAEAKHTGELAALRERVAELEAGMAAALVAYARLMGSHLGLMNATPLFTSKAVIEVLIAATGWDRDDERLEEFAAALDAEWKLHHRGIVATARRFDTDVALDWAALEEEIFGDPSPGDRENDA